MISDTASFAAAIPGFDLATWPIAVGAFAGAALSVIVAESIKSVMARRTKRHDMQMDNLRDATVEVTSQALRMLHLVGSKGAPVDLAKLENAHEGVRIGVGQLQLVGGAEVQLAAMLVRHHSYSMREKGKGLPDKHEDYGVERYERLEQAVEHLLGETRRQLAVGGRVTVRPDYLQMTRRLAGARVPGLPVGATRGVADVDV
ncbi:hypothetical protein BJQ94_13660 [Cryobacterium sp. SO2]|uniref:hypothetical protein n=1 Tax=Cryobacterium sp. SO2 TaxID=1897060 RepID=UPI00223D29E3|nr:hypothetical protein [Cryobacterium sp. SO2]WEO76406.1 hypothetical protein BJQ94_13660 [Cryobacterium sp. SO2]